MMKNFRLIYPPGYDIASERRMEDYSFIRSLQIDDMVVIKQENYRGFSELRLENYYSAEPEVLDYRLAVVEDLVENPTLYKAFTDSVRMITNINDLSRVMRTTPDGLSYARDIAKRYGLDLEDILG